MTTTRRSRFALVLLTLGACGIGCKRETQCPKESTEGQLAEPWTTLGLRVPAGAKTCRSTSSSTSNEVTLTRNGSDLGSAVVDPFVAQLTSAGFSPDAAHTGGAGTFSRIGLQRQLLGVEITSSVRDDASTVSLATYAACTGDDPALKGSSLADRLGTLLAGESDHEYCASLRSVLSDGDPFAVNTQPSTTTEAPKDLLDALAKARSRGSKVTLFQPVWGPDKGDPKRWNKTTYANKAYEGARERLQAKYPDSPPTVAFVGDQRFGFFSPMGIWIGP